MIEITRCSDGISIKGHAGYAEPGKDIVCAGVSTLAYTLIESVEKLTEDKIDFKEWPGMMEIKFWSLSDKSKVLVDSFFIGLMLIAGTYPAHVKIM